MIPLGVFGHTAAAAASQARPQNTFESKQPRGFGATGASVARHLGFKRTGLRSQPAKSLGPPIDFVSSRAAQAKRRPAGPEFPQIAAAEYSKEIGPGPQHSPVDSVLSFRGKASPGCCDFSWQHCAAQSHLRVRTRHIEIVIPPWARSSSLPSPPLTPKSWTCRLSDFPAPPGAATELGEAEEELLSMLDDDYGRLRFAETEPSKGSQPETPPRCSFSKMNGSSSSPERSDYAVQGQENFNARAAAAAAAPSNSHPAISPPSSGAAMNTSAPANNLSSLVCNVHRTTGERPPALVGASTTISGDKLYVFGGRRLSRRKTQLTQDLYELKLINRHWTRLQTLGDVPLPRYFHSCCSIGDTKLAIYGGMAPVAAVSNSHGDSMQHNDTPQAEPGIVVMSDIHIYDIASKTWTAVEAANAPTGRYAHCAAVLPSSSYYTSENARLSGAAGNPASPNPDQGRGGAEMIIVGGQDGASRYIEQISVFNLRSLKWTSTTNHGKSCGAYRSVVTPITSIRTSPLGSLSSENGGQSQRESDEDELSADEGHATLIYSNYNFLDVKLELQIRTSDGKLDEKTIMGSHSPPGLRFPNGDIVGNHFVVSGTFLTSLKHEYALWALDLRSLTWSRIDTGPGILTSGSWNRGVLWKKRNTFVILGDRRRSLSEDYNHRRLNFTNVCNVELEAFGLYDNPVTSAPLGYGSTSSPPWEKTLSAKVRGPVPATVASVLGRSVSELREAADMDFLAMGGERVPVNSHIAIRRWGPYLVNLLERNVVLQENGLQAPNGRPGLMTQASRNSSITITQGSVNSFSNTINDAFDNISSTRTASPAATLRSASSKNSAESSQNATSLRHSSRSRVLYLPHTCLTIRALVYYLYTWSLPPPGSPLCSLQILCSLLQLARPYRVNGLLEATVERLHQVLDGRNTAAIFNAAAMAAGGGESVAFVGDLPDDRRQSGRPLSALPRRDVATEGASNGRMNPDDPEDDVASNISSSATSLSGIEQEGAEPERVWTGDLSSVVGLQKRGLRGLMEGRRQRERSNGEEAANHSGITGDGSGVGLGIG